MFDFSSFAAVLLDLDGTIYSAMHALPGAVELVQRLQNERRTYACLSNSTDSPNQVAGRLAAMRIPVDRSHIYTATAATADFVMQQFRSIGRPQVFNLATAGIHELLDGQVDWVETSSQPCQAVIAGTVTGMYAGPDRQRIALELLRNGATLVGICADRVYPSPRGIEFGSGALCAMLAYAANVKPIFCGKPEPLFFHELCHRIGVPTDRCILIGDNLESDVAGAKAVGMKTVLTLGGVTRLNDLNGIPPEKQPDFVIENLWQLLK